ncbi:hypothetical protein F511_33520 [Dorcoceras hygrometricum]|uniref:Uncharacterized protein n=1 Tax=Dorcoceras hygrometricum TaxID=472368 RepID=A0A2Z7BJF8_9LAMI|nr:hypothetical protein F511_33520 [Dorcoceras hygrometricum]
MGTDQLDLHSVQPGYVKNLQWETQTQATQMQEENTRSNLSTKSNLKTPNHATCYISSYEMHDGYQGIGHQGQQSADKISTEPPTPRTANQPVEIIDCGRNRQSGPRPETRLLRQPALEGLRSARTNSPRRIGRKRFSGEATAGGGACREEGGRRPMLGLGLGLEC